MGVDEFEYSVPGNSLYLRPLLLFSRTAGAAGGKPFGHIRTLK